MKQIIRVLQFSTHNEDCGIAKYQQQFVDTFKGIPDIETEYFEYSPNIIKNLSEAQQSEVLKEFTSKLNDFDLLHIQHELSFFKKEELARIIEIAKVMDKKVLITVHTAPAAQYQRPKLGGLGPRSLLHYAKSRISSKRFINKYFTPLKKADLLIVHNNPTKQDLITHGIEADRILIVTHPVPVIKHKDSSHEITSNLRTSKQDIIFATVGFMSRAKGILHAVKALSLLPNNYKLAIIGGMHPDSDDTAFYDEVVDLIVHLGLQDRVYITGFVEEDNRLYGLVQEVDICVYPYDKKYYSYVSSGSLNIAIANNKPVISYPTKSFIEINSELDVVVFCKSSNYYELTRELKHIDIKHYSKMSEQYAELHAWNKSAEAFCDIYRQLANS